jgi:hypothetical protein
MCPRGHEAKQFFVFLSLQKLPKELCTLSCSAKSPTTTPEPWLPRLTSSEHPTTNKSQGLLSASPLLPPMMREGPLLQQWAVSSPAANGPPAVLHPNLVPAAKKYGKPRHRQPLPRLLSPGIFPASASCSWHTVEQTVYKDGRTSSVQTGRIFLKKKEFFQKLM